MNNMRQRMDPLLQAVQGLARGSQVFLRDVGHGLLEVSHNTFALVGFAAATQAGNAANQSLAEATVPPGSATIEHFHRTSEEIYLFLSGAGRMRSPPGWCRMMTKRRAFSGGQ